MTNQIRPLYEPMPLSPHTWLSTAIDATQTSFSVYDTSVFPLPPFYITLIDGANTETCLVRAVSPTTLASITRGVEGTAIGHAINTPLARNWTAADHSDIIANNRYLFAAHVIGIEWDTAAVDTSQMEWIDLDGNVIDEPPFLSFDDHITIGTVGRCLVSPTGAVTVGPNARGDTLTLDGSQGRVMVKIPKFWWRYERVGTKERQWISPFPLSGFSVFPAFLMEGGIERDWIFIGAYEGSMTFADYPLHADQRLVLNSSTGKQPLVAPYMDLVGGAVTIAFKNGSVEPTLGETISSPGALSGTLVDYVKTSGTWSGHDAYGYLLVAGQVSESFAENAGLSGTTSGTDFAFVTPAEASFVELGSVKGREYAANIGAGWGIVNAWTRSAALLLMAIEYKSFNFQGLIGRGIVDMGSGSPGYFNGLPCGANSADSMIGTNGTGAGLGTNGQTTIVWRGIENLWGNVSELVDGIESTADEWHILRRDGLGKLGTPMPFGSYESTEAVPLSTQTDPPSANGIISEFLSEPAAQGLFLPAATVPEAQGDVYTRDYCNVRVGSTTNSVYAGGHWSSGNQAGPFALNISRATAATDGWYCGVRLQYIGPNPGTTVPQVGGVEVRTPYPSQDAYAVPLTRLPPPTAPQVITQHTLWGGTLDWTKTDHLRRQDGGRAKVTGAGIVKTIEAVSYGFAIPSNATILGIEVKIWRIAATKGATHTRDAYLNLVYGNGSFSAESKAATTTDWDTVNEVVTYGAWNDDWGVSWTPAMINDGNFGVAYQVENTGSNTAYIDFIGISVAYEV